MHSLVPIDGLSNLADLVFRVRLRFSRLLRVRIYFEASLRMGLKRRARRFWTRSSGLVLLRNLRLWVLALNLWRCALVVDVGYALRLACAWLTCRAWRRVYEL